MKIAYCGYDFFSACLSELLANEIDVYRVFTVPCDNRIDFNEYIHEICHQYKLPVTEQHINEKMLQQLEKEGCELIITAAYQHKIPDLSATGIKGINIHPTLLPQGRGVMPLPWVILKQLQQSGITIHKLSDEFDAGDILLQKSFAISDSENMQTLSARCQMLAKDMMLDVIKRFDHYWDNAAPQSGPVSFWGRPTQEQRTLDWHNSVAEIDRMSRAYAKTGCYARFDDNDWVVYGLKAWEQAHDFKVGEVVHKTNTEMIVAAADGLVSLLYFELV